MKILNSLKVVTLALSYGLLGEVAAEVGNGGKSAKSTVAAADLSRCTMMLDSLKDGAIELEKKLSTCENTLTDTKHSLVETEKSFSKFKETNHLDMNELQDLRLRNRKVQDGLTDKEMDLLALQKSKAALEKNNTQLIRIGQSYRSKNKDLKQQVENALQYLEEERQKTEDLKKEVVDRDQTIQRLKEKIDSLGKTVIVQENIDLKKGKEDLEGKVAKLREEMDELTSSMEEAHDAIKMKDNAVNELTEKLEVKTKEYEDLAETESEMEAEFEAAKKMNEQLKEEVSKLNAELDSTKTHLKQVGSEMASVESHVDELNQQREAAKEESEKLKKLFEQYKEKVDDPALMDYFMKKAEWLKHPRMEGVDNAYEKASKLLGPKLHPTHAALLEMQDLLKASENRLMVAVGEDSKLSPWLSGLLTYGILVVPLGLTMLLLVRLKRCISLTKATMLMTLYNAIFSLTLFAMSFAVESQEAMAAFRGQNKEAFDFLQIMIPVYYALYLIANILLAFKFTIQLRCKCSLRVALMLFVPGFVMFRYHRLVWLRAMRDQPLLIEREEWGYYGLAYGVLFCLVTCFAPQSDKSNASQSEAMLPLLQRDGRSKGNGTSRKHGHLVDAKEQEREEGEHVINLNAEIRSPEELVNSAKETADMMKEKAEDFAESLSSGRPLSEITNDKKKKKKKEKKSSKSKKKEANSDSENAEDRKVD